MATGVGQGVNLNDTMKLANPENPQFGIRIFDISPIQCIYCL